MNNKEIIEKNFKKINKNYKEIEKTKKDINLKWEEKQKILHTSDESFNKNLFNNKDLNQKYQNLTDEIEKLHKKQKILQIETRITENNNYYILGKYTENEIYTILHKYDNKKIGEATRLRISHEIMEKVEKDISKDLNVYVNIYREYDWSSFKTLKLDFVFTKKSGYSTNYTLEIDMYDETHKINTSFKNYTYSENTRKDAKDFYKNYLKLKIEIDNTLEKYQEKISDFNKIAIGYLKDYQMASIHR